MKKLIFLWVLFCFINFFSASSQISDFNEVYVCATGKVYHFNPNCKGISNCQSGIESFDLAEILANPNLKKYNKKCGFNCKKPVAIPSKTPVSVKNNYYIIIILGVLLIASVILTIKYLIDKGFQGITNKLDDSARELKEITNELKSNAIQFESLKNEAHFDYLMQSLNNAQKSILITSGWISSNVVDIPFCKMLKRKINDGVEVFIYYGYLFKGEHNNSSPVAIDYLEKLSVYSNGRMSIKKGGGKKGIHSKCLIIDGEITAIGSYNWLSSGRIPSNTEESIIVRDKIFALKQIDFFKTL